MEYRVGYCAFLGDTMENDYKKLIKSEATKIIGFKQVARHIESKNLSLVILAVDADTFFKDKVVTLCKKNNITILNAESKKELANLVGVAVPTAVVGIIEKA